MESLGPTGSCTLQGLLPKSKMALEGFGRDPGASYLGVMTFGTLYVLLSLPYSL